MSCAWILDKSSVHNFAEGECNPDGTMKVETNGRCTCHAAYAGARCISCNVGYQGDGVTCTGKKKVANIQIPHIYEKRMIICI